MYVAKVEEESTKKALQTSEPDEKENGRIAATSKQVERVEEKLSPTPEHRRRKVHTLKLKLPGDQEETRKRRHSSHRRRREEMTEVCMKNVHGIIIIPNNCFQLIVQKVKANNLSLLVLHM